MADAAPLRRIVAHLYQRSGRAAQSESELANALSLDLKWFPPTNARNLVAALARAGYLERTDDGDLRPTFDVRHEPVPLGFRPPPDLPHDLPPPGATPAAPAAVAARAAPAPQAARAPPPRPEPEPAVDTTQAAVGLGALLEALAQASHTDVPVWVARMEELVQRTNDVLTPEAALLLAAAQAGVDVSPWAPAVKAVLHA